jgi:hypothetical protein
LEEEMKKGIWTASLLIALSLILLGACTPTPDSPDAAQNVTNKLVVLNNQALENTTYHYADGKAPLRDGIYTAQYQADSASELVVQLGLERIYGDINADGQEDAVTTFVVAPGGSGVFIHLALVTVEDNEVVNAASEFLGDRTQINDLRIEAGQIIVDMITLGPDDPMCCPSLHVVRAYNWQDRQLVLESETIMEDTGDEEITAFPTDLLANAFYRLGDREIQLTDGAFREEDAETGTETLVQLSELMAFDDLNGDGRTDAAVLLTETTAGEETTTTLALVSEQSGQASSFAVTLLGREVGVDAMWVEDGKIVLSMRVPGERACCDEIYVIRGYALQDGGLTLVSEDRQTLEQEPVLVPNDILANLTYTFSYVEGDVESIPMTDGSYEFVDTETGERVAAGLLDTRTFGDLNGDGQADAVVIFWVNYGGSGVFEYLSAVVAQDGTYANIASVFLGDRVLINDLQIENGHIVVDMITHGPEDPLCCPTLAVVEKFELVGEQLIAVE